MRESLKESDNSFKDLWNIRKGLDQHVDVLSQGQGPSEIRKIKSSLMDLMQANSPDENVREAFKRYAERIYWIKRRKTQRKQ